MPPTIGQLVLLLVTIVLFAVGGGMSFARTWTEHPTPRLVSRLLLILGILASGGVIVWHAVSRRQWVPVGDNFDALVWLATLLALFVLYVQRHTRLGALDWFVMPVVLLLLIAAAIIGRTDYHEYRQVVTDVWSWVHRVTAYGGAVAFAIAAASGAMYVAASRKLRHKKPIGPQFGSLERLEHITMVGVTLGFALLTIGMVTGGVQMFEDPQKHQPTSKIVLAVAVWFVYAVVLHAPINPSFRGRKVAVLSVVGFLLMLGTIVTVLLLPSGTGGGGQG
jgi:ABC-type uncharacterized transport system permease subunit